MNGSGILLIEEQKPANASYTESPNLNHDDHQRNRHPRPENHRTTDIP